MRITFGSRQSATMPFLVSKSNTSLPLSPNSMDNWHPRFEGSEGVIISKGRCVIEVWDGGVVDGDVITVLYNDAPLLTNYMLEKAHKQLRIPITKKKSTVTVIAIDEGANPPNTADILLIDGVLRYKITAYNSKGKKAVIILNKK